MGTITAGEIVAQCQELAQDDNGDIWTDAQGINWVNEAQRAVALVRVDSSVSRGSILLAQGIKQTITGRRLVSIHYNMGSDGLTVGAPIRLVGRAIKDDSDPLWTTEAASTEVLEYLYDADSPTVFQVSPPVPASPDVYIEVTQAINPVDCSTLSSTIDLEDVYAAPMVEWVMYRFFGRDSEETPNNQRAVTHYRSFFNLLGEKMKSDVFSNPHYKKKSREE